MVVVPKGTIVTWQMCIEFHNLNKVCRKDHYSLPRIDLLVDSISSCELISMMDACQDYHQITINPADIPIAGYGVGTGTLGYRSMPFGLKNINATYQGRMDMIFQNQIGQNMELYANDLLVNSIKAETHAADLHKIFKVV